MESAMKHAHEEISGVIVLKLGDKIMGETDDNQIVNLVHEFVDQGKIKVVLDFTDVTWMNSRGLGLCISAMTTLRTAKGDLRLAGTTGAVTKLFEVTQVFALFKSFDTVDEAVASFQ
jgi:anti-sigma B factor antagonist